MGGGDRDGYGVGRIWDVEVGRIVGMGVMEICGGYGSEWVG